MTMRGPKVFYVVYWGATEPLGQSLVLPAVRRLAAAGARLTLLTFDKAADYEDTPKMAATRAALEAEGVAWIALRYHKRPMVPATAWDILHGWISGVLAARRARPDLVHGRTFVGGIIGRLIATTLRTRFIYHNEGFYPDEQVDGGFWAAGSILHRVARWVETRLYASADGLIALSYRAQAVLEARPRVAVRHMPVIVVPSCVDVDHFRCDDRAPRGDGVLRCVYIGAVGGRYGLDRAGRFCRIAARRGPTRLRVLTRADPALVESMLDEAALPRNAWSRDVLPHASMPGELARHDAGLFFLTQGLSEHGCSPTKVGEYWACGLPVVTTPNVSDLDGIIDRERVGVVVRGESDADYEEAAHRLRELLRDRELSLRCRRAAATHYALGPACDRQLALYRRLVGSADASPAPARPR